MFFHNTVKPSSDGGRAESSSELFEMVLKTIESQGSIATRFGGVVDVAFTVKSLIGSWTIARRSGDDQRSAELLREIRICLCSPSAQLRKTVADYLADRGESLLALEVYEALLPMTVMGTQDSTGLYDVARSYALLPDLLNDNGGVMRREIEQVRSWFFSDDLHYHTAKMRDAGAFRGTDLDD